MKKNRRKKPVKPVVKWTSLLSSTLFLLSSKKLMGLSFVLFLVTALLTLIGYTLAWELIDQLTSSFFLQPPDPETIWGWMKNKSWYFMKWMFIIVARVAAFYLAFIIAYCITVPGYVMLSVATEKKNEGGEYEIGEKFTLKSSIFDAWEGVKIGMVGLVIPPLALICTFIPIVGLLIAFLLYAYYSALMFVDYPSSRRRWTLGKKMGWVYRNWKISLRIGIIPAFLSMIPVVSIFFMAMIFPLMTVHTTLNYIAIEKAGKNGKEDGIVNIDKSDLMAS